MTTEDVLHDRVIYHCMFAVSLTGLFPVKTATEGDSSVSLICQMDGYIRPDSTFQWRRGDVTLTNNRKYNITISDGPPGVAQDGGDELVNARISILLVFSVEEADQGGYTCFVEGTDASAQVQLIVNSGEHRAMSHSTNNCQTTLEHVSRVIKPLAIGVGVSLLLMTIILVAALMIVLYVRCKKKSVSAASPSTPEPVYEEARDIVDNHFIMTPSSAYGRATVQLPDVMSENLAYNIMELETQ